MTQAQKLRLARAAFRLAEAEVTSTVAHVSFYSDKDLSDAARGRLQRIASALGAEVCAARENYVRVRRECGLPEIKP